MSSRTLLPRVKEDGAELTSGVDLVPPLALSGQTQHSPSTMLRQLNEGGSRRQSFFANLQEQIVHHQLDDVEQEKRNEVLNIHRILQRPPEVRDSTDIDTLYDWVMSNGSTNKIFQGAQEIICKTICREMTLLELPARGVVCYQGDYGDIFFIIISGSVSLYVETKKKLLLTTNDNTGAATDRTSEFTAQDRYRQHRVTSEFDDENKQTEFKPDMYGSFIKQIGAGGTFGELAVMDPTAKRSCTILCDAPTSFICLKRAAYQRLIRITNSSQLDFTQVEFLETLYFFERWPHSELMRVSNRLRHMTFPAGNHLARIASEANLIFFIYSGVVQESIPLVHHLNGNGNVVNCTTLESDSALRISLPDVSLADQKQQQQRQRIALEVNLYQDHDICGEFPIIFNKPTSNTDLLAVTDVKVLIMDRETWRDVFAMHGLEHVKVAHRRFRQLAQARETWRQTRLKLELANPGLHITLSTKAMMQDGKCMCGWCGSNEHITGDLACPALVASKQRQADKLKQKNAEKTSPLYRRARTLGGGGSGAGDGMSGRATAVKNTLTFVNQLHETATRKASALAMGISLADYKPGSAAQLRPTTPRTPSGGNNRTGTPRQSALREAAQKIISDNHMSAQEPEATGEHDGSVPSESVVEVSPRKKAVVATKSSGDIMWLRTNNFYEVIRAVREEEEAANSGAVVAPTKVEEVRKGAFTEELSLQYRHELVRKTKRIANVQQYYETREQVLEQIQREDCGQQHTQQHDRQQPRKPKIPKPARRLAMCSKNREPCPDRFNRKINRILKKMWTQDHPVAVVEESLRELS